ncbi:MAG: N-acyl homoserine lactonase family protein [Halobacteriales archaeon]|nr:N-acyl homoserine lactonase family protein [Halobacteriales archaeon]
MPASPTVTPLCCGTVRLDKSILTAGVDVGTRIDAPSICYLIEGEQTVLVDTSFGELEYMDEIHPSFECRRSDEQTVSGALGQEGLEPTDIDQVFLTHLHWDHCYNLDRFEMADIYVSRTELEYAIAPYPIHAGGYDAKSVGRTPPWLDVHLQPIEGETELCPGVTAFPTPGHTIGHYSVAIETDEGTVVAAADAIPTFENLDGSGNSPYIRGLSVNDFEWWHSANRIDDRADRILPGHEWGILEAGPSRTGTT